jgi:hypothetical protein
MNSTKKLLLPTVLTLHVTVYDLQGFNSLYSDCGLQSYLQGHILKDSDNSIVL